MNPRCMRHAVTIGTQRHHFMLILMAVDAGQRLMFGRGRVQLVSLVAGRAILCRDLLGMSLMADCAFGNVAVGVGMTEITGHFGVRAGIGCELLPDRVMAGQAFRFKLPVQSEFKGSMRIGMALGAILDFIIMGRPGMAHCTCGNVVGNFGWMPYMAIEAGNCRFMRHPLLFDLLRHRLMALQAV